MAPPIETEQAESDSPPAAVNVPSTRTPQAPRIPVTPAPLAGITEEDIRYVNTHPPVSTEVGLATWYSAPYKGRKAANGALFDDAALTAAHRTLPMGSLIVVTNLKTGEWSAMRITDRGPFVDGWIDGRELTLLLWPGETFYFHMNAKPTSAPRRATAPESFPAVLRPRR